MVSIDLDNIIHYHPPPTPKPPLQTTTPDYFFSWFFPSPLKSALPNPYSTSAPPSPSPVVSCLPSDRDAHLNEFDKELASLGLAEIESQETPGLCFGGSEERQAENIDNIQRKELYGVHGRGSHTNDHHRDDLPLSQDPATPQDTAASNAVGSGLSSAAGPPASPVRADGSVSPDELCPTDLSSAECRESQLSLVGYETEYDCNVLRDQPLPHNPSIPIPARDETEPANQRLFRCSSEAGAEPRKSSLPPVLEAHSIQLQTRDLSPTRDSHLGVRNDGIEAYSTDCRLGDETLSSPVSPVQTGSGSEGEDTPRDLSRSCSVSVVVPVTWSYGLPIIRSTRTSRNLCTRKRKSRAKSTCDVDSDDPDDSDYTDRNDSGVGDIAASPRLVKRQRRTAARKTQPARVQRESPHHVFSSPAPEEAFANPYPATTLQDMQTIPVRGFLTRQTFLSRVVYSYTFEEDRQPSCPHRPTPTKAPAHDENLDETGHPTLPSSKKPSAHATRFLPDEDELLIELKEKRSLPWSRIGEQRVLSRFAIAQGSRTEELEVSGEVGVDGLHVLRRRVRLHKRHLAYSLGHKWRGEKEPIQSL
ncbi:hypothetical protein N7512_001193 [Penicillium capsulatum]|nr:hypothetical protein N7512_001193 [Penicillium capsulatum]